MTKRPGARPYKHTKKMRPAIPCPVFKSGDRPDDGPKAEIVVKEVVRPAIPKPYTASRRKAEKTLRISDPIPLSGGNRRKNRKTGCKTANETGARTLWMIAVLYG
jgi:hypothetical protein